MHDFSLLCVMKQRDLNYLSLELVILEITFYTYFFIRSVKMFYPLQCKEHRTAYCLNKEHRHNSQWELWMAVL